mmetsp:Transcript_4495/g.16422  ORF Transcript_4495/g.16422 Transcript_4495/m.16422 type:complete len:360 (-) Transcript_4495:52-1131(-)
MCVTVRRMAMEKACRSSSVAPSSPRESLHTHSIAAATIAAARAGSAPTRSRVRRDSQASCMASESETTTGPFATAYHPAEPGPCGTRHGNNAPSMTSSTGTSVPRPPARSTSDQRDASVAASSSAAGSSDDARIMARASKPIRAAAAVSGRATRNPCCVTNARATCCKLSRSAVSAYRAIVVLMQRRTRPVSRRSSTPRSATAVERAISASASAGTMPGSPPTTTATTGTSSSSPSSSASESGSSAPPFLSTTTHAASSPARLMLAATPDASSSPSPPRDGAPTAPSALAAFAAAVSASTSAAAAAATTSAASAAAAASASAAAASSAAARSCSGSASTDLARFSSSSHIAAVSGRSAL